MVVWGTKMNELKYLLDDKPMSAIGLIEKASELQKDFGSDGIKTTSEAANILRKFGYTVQENINGGRLC